LVTERLVTIDLSASLQMRKRVTNPILKVGVVSEVTNLESSGVEAPDRRPRDDEPYYEPRFRIAC
jgi:hypothetical protein